MASPLEFYFDFASPYAYIAAKRIDALAARHGRDVIWRPILLGAVFKVTGAQPLVRIPLRREYTPHDVRRSARLYGIPLTWPEVMPMNPLAASRAFYWLDARDPVAARELAHAFYDAHWGQGRDLSSPESVLRVAATTGIDPQALAAGLDDPAVKDRLRREVDHAVGRGVFGAPFLFVDQEPFWGADRLDQAERWLETGGW